MTSLVFRIWKCSRTGAFFIFRQPKYIFRLFQFGFDLRGLDWDWDWEFGLRLFNKTCINDDLSVQTEDGDYLALTGQPKKLEEDLKLEEAGTDYSEDYGEDYEDDYEEEEQAGVTLMFQLY